MLKNLAQSRFVKKLLQFTRLETGAIFAEALIVIPVITIFAVGVLEFSNVLWQRHQMQVGVRDAARYWSRCRPTFHNCTIATARNIAFYAHPSGSGQGTLRVPGWNEDSELSIDPAAPVFPSPATQLVTAVGTLEYQASPLFGFLQVGDVTLRVSHQERIIGW
ncbi:MAG: TadE/TadG family type IV pilus assembly protein [Rhizobiaceae bacterium]